MGNHQPFGLFLRLCLISRLCSFCTGHEERAAAGGSGRGRISGPGRQGRLQRAVVRILSRTAANTRFMTFLSVRLVFVARGEVYIVAEIIFGCSTST